MQLDEKLKIRDNFIVDIRRHLKRYNAFESIDKHVLDRMATWHSNFIEAKDNVDMNGATQTAKTGFTTMTGEYQAMVAAERMLQSLYTKFGIDLLTRNKLNLESKKKTKKDDGLIK